jgi:hypothetical protein
MVSGGKQGFNLTNGHVEANSVYNNTDFLAVVEIRN